MAIIEDQTGYVELVWFQKYQYLGNIFKEGDIVIASGKVSYFNGISLAHPEFEIIDSIDEEPIHTGRIIPIYPENMAFRQNGLTSRGLRRIIKPALDTLSGLPCETLPESGRREYGLIDLTRAIRQVHFPDSHEMADMGRQRLSFEELFHLELILVGRQKKRHSKTDGIELQPPRKHGRELLGKLGFSLTGAQKKVLREIYDDMAAKYQMNRLLQGDVGSGKTIVAVLAMLGAVESGYQAAIMAPTEILAEQHYFSVSELLQPIGIPVKLLTGSVKGRGRKEAFADVESGTCPVVIGTHALIEKKVKFAKLGFVVIDEQHRFGVMQRATLQSKGRNPDILVMTATPIPRTLAMTAYGDLDVSIIDEMPPGRVSIVTKYVTEDKRPEMYQFIRKQAREGRSAYIVYPLVEETEKSDLAAATQAFEHLKRDIFPDLKLGLLHGRMKSADKQSTMAAFKNRDIEVMVATTVVEVGVDVAQATIMVIEHAERFGLSQLHQLRGRVGRSGIQSYCFLLTGERCSEDAQKRIDVIISTTDGFKIAEADLELRGPGEILGTRQHGIPELRVARITDSRLVTLARRLAYDIVNDDPSLAKPENQQLKIILKKRLGGRLKFAKVG
ncbi:MAG: ATP-dependent DNA helicase RecG [candidate division Zixibacteria bacterium RBG_16_53_22]|nr:MAG: ATP-dependent DNA helicase RecG [candidate division Zixibacteria bacterium RBG_16_53_22]